MKLHVVPPPTHTKTRASRGLGGLDFHYNSLLLFTLLYRKGSLSDDTADLDQLISDICCDDDDDSSEIASNSRANLASKQSSGSHKKR